MDVKTEWFSASELAKLAQAGTVDIPRSERRVKDKIRKLGWLEQEIHGKGGPRGLKTVFRPPEKILSEIQDFLRKSPDFFNKASEPEVSSKPCSPTSKVTKLRLATRIGDYNGPNVEQHPHVSRVTNTSVSLPHYDAEASAGRGSLINEENIVGYITFEKGWLRNLLGITSNNLAIISVKGDSMEPTLKTDDLIMIDLNKAKIKDDAIYVLQHNDGLLVKRIQPMIDGGATIKSDNLIYGNEKLDASQVEQVHVVGRVVWFSRRM